MPSSIRAALSSYLEAPKPPGFANRLAAPQPQCEPPARIGLVLVLLIVACLVPRAAMAWRITTVCVDGVVYFRLADALEQGHVDANDAGRLQAGTFPMALSVLHRLGMDWEMAARCYGVALSTLAVLPLFGWVRRQFDVGVAFVACLLYAVHPKLIEWSPEAVREPSFWFFFLLAIYCLWRAAVEVDRRFFVAGGAATALACLTRFEGWFLLFPLLSWTGLRFVNLRAGRLRLVSGCACSLAVVPAVLFAFGLLQPGDGGWSHLRIEPIERASEWLLSWSGPSDAAAAAPQAAVAQPAAPAPAAWSVAQTAWVFAHTAERGLTPVFAILIFGGYLGQLRFFNRSDNLPILLVVLAVAAGIWIHLWYAHQASSRYVLTIVLLSTRSAAIGLLDFARLTGRWLSARWLAARTAMAAGLLSIVALVGVVDAVTSNFQSRAALAGLGKWIRTAHGADCLVVGSENQLQLVGYYAEARAFAFPPQLSGEDLARWIADVKPDVVVISRRRQVPAEFQMIVDQRDRLGLAVVTADEISCDTKNMLVLSRREQAGQAIRQATRVTTNVP
jgi:4-amino-4-deoxy-L-arabinose transferase-like glycosyltransferase